VDERELFGIDPNMFNSTIKNFDHVIDDLQKWQLYLAHNLHVELLGKVMEEGELTELMTQVSKTALHDDRVFEDFQRTQDIQKAYDVLANTLTAKGLMEHFDV
jgi:hypothetical protein